MSYNNYYDVKWCHTIIIMMSISCHNKLHPIIISKGHHTVQ